MALFPSSAPPSVRLRLAPLGFTSGHRRSCKVPPSPNPNLIPYTPQRERRILPFVSSETLLPPPKCRGRTGTFAASNLCEQESVILDMSSLDIRESASEEELWAAVRLRIRTFYEFNQTSIGVEDHKKYLMEREFEALKDRIAGKRIGFKRVSCINATLPLSPSLGFANELYSTSKFYENGEGQVVVGTLDLNQCCRLADELTGKRPEGIGADVMRAYLSNVCVAKEMQRNGLGYALVAKSKKVARQWGISDLYIHVAVDNDAARRLYEKSGFTYENEEPAWQARFLGRPRRLLLWADLTTHATSPVMWRNAIQPEGFSDSAQPD